MKLGPITKTVCIAMLMVGTITATGQLQLIYPPISQIFNASATSKSEDSTEKRLPILQQTQKGTDVVPDKIVYFILFNHLVGLKEQAEKAAAKGDSLNYHKLYEDQANLNDSQSQFLFQNAQDCIYAVKLIDQEAKEIIIRARRGFPNGEVKSPEDIPPPPKELNELQKQKDETILRFRDELKRFLGTEKFAEFNQFAQDKIAPHVKTDILTQEVK